MPTAALGQVIALVLGVGAVGRQVALQLAAIGVPRMVLFDHDTVEIENLASQGYPPKALGAKKVVAMQEDIAVLNPDVKLSVIPNKFSRYSLRSLNWDDYDMVVFDCVDGIETRKMVWENVRGLAKFYVESRMAAEVIRVLAVANPLVDDYYATTLFPGTEAFQARCTAKSTIYTASIAAGMIVHQFTRWLRNMPVDKDVLFNLLASELTVKE